MNYVDFSKSILSSLYNDDSASIPLMVETFIEQCHQHRIHPSALKTCINKCLDYIPLSDNKITVMNAEQYEANKTKVWESKSSEAVLTNAVEAFDTLSFWTDAPGAVDSTVTKKEIADVISYIGLHYRDKLTLEMIANHVNFSENYLSRVFREQVGMSLFQYINYIRMNKAAELIMKGQTYMKEVASAVGISDQFYFSRMFKKQFGVSPTDYKSHAMQSSQPMK